MFVSEERVRVSLDDRDAIYIRPKMSFAQRERAEDAVRAISGTVGGAASVAVNIGAYRIALLHINVLDWEGPSFQGVKCTPENIDRLDPDEPLIERVMEEIANRNPMGGKRAAPAVKGDGTDPLSASGNDGSALLPEGWTQSESGNGTPTSYSPNGITGPPPLPEVVTPTS